MPETSNQRPPEPEGGSPVRVLVIDDEPQLQRLLRIALEDAHYRVSMAGTGHEGLARAARASPELVLLDADLPDLSGMEVLRQLREWTQLPVILLGVEEDAARKIEALDRGADDYVTKPFHTGELLARIRAVLRRGHRGPAAEPVFQRGDLTVDLGRRRVTLQGRPVKLTSTEYSLLRLFVQHPGKVLTHRQILREVWGADHEERTQYLRVYMTRLREKLAPDAKGRPLFQTEVAVGYRLLEA